MRGRAVPAAFVILSACGHKPPPPKPVERVVATASASGSAAPLPPAPTAPEEVVIEEPRAACVIEDDAPTDFHARMAFATISIAHKPVAQVSAMGRLRHVRIALSDAQDEKAFAKVSADGEIASIRGFVPTMSEDDTRPALLLFPRSPLFQEQWLEHKEVVVDWPYEDGVTVGNRLFGWIDPIASGTEADDYHPKIGEYPFSATCKELTPFETVRAEPRDGTLVGTKIVLENDAGKKVASIDSPKPGRPVAVRSKAKGKTKIRLQVGAHAYAEGWVKSNLVKPLSASGAAGFGSGSGGMYPRSSITCPTEVPLHVRIDGTTYAVGMLHAKHAAGGERGDGGFVISQFGPKSFSLPFVPASRLASCAITAAP